MAYPCPQCNDQSTQRISLLYDLNTRRWKDHLGRARSSQSDLASKYSPPQPRGYFWRGLAVFFLSLFGSVFGLTVGQQLHMPLLGVALFWIVLGASAYWLIGGAKSYNAKVWPPAMREWESLFICRGCGYTFVPPCGAPSDIHPGRLTLEEWYQGEIPSLSVPQNRVSRGFCLSISALFAAIVCTCTNPGDIHKLTRFLHLYPQIERAYCPFN